MAFHPLRAALCGAAFFALTAPALRADTPTPEQKSLLLQMQDAFTKIASSVEPTVVNIKAERLPDPSDVDLGLPMPVPKATPKGKSPSPLPRSPQPRRSTGSGVIVRPDGYILTNDHVVEGAIGGTVTVTLADGREFTGKVFPDYRSDLAVVKIDPGAQPLPAATFADSNKVIPGQWAIAVGSPFDLQNTLTVGIISATGRHQQIPGETRGTGRYYPDLIQTDAAINPGNSGGPLFNVDGQVIGINVAIESPVEGSAGIGFAIPSGIAQGIMTSLIQNGRIVRGQLGVVPDDLTPPLQEYYHQKDGAFLRDVLQKSPAASAGLQASDIVTEFDGRPIRGEVDLRAAISSTPPNKRVTLRYVRGGQTLTATAKIGPAPATDEDKPVPAPPAPKTRLGLTVRDLTASDRKGQDLPGDTEGVIITAVEPGSPADRVGLGVGLGSHSLIIQKIGQTAITSKADFDRAVASLAGAKIAPVVVIYKSGGDGDDAQVHQSAFTLRL